MSPTSTPQALLRVDTLGCERGGRLLFDNLSLQLNRGEGLRIEGGNGSGKTSLLRLLAGLSQPQRGRVQWPAGSPPQLLYIGHLAAVKALLSPLENLQWWAALHAPAAASDRSALLAALTAAGIGAALEQPCHSLSAGQPTPADSLVCDRHSVGRAAPAAAPAPSGARLSQQVAPAGSGGVAHPWACRGGRCPAGP